MSKSDVSIEVDIQTELFMTALLQSQHRHQILRTAIHDIKDPEKKSNVLGVAILGRRSSGQEGEVGVGLFQYGKTSNDQSPRSGKWL